MENDLYVKHLILGTAGHIDHGKSSLVLNLTGIDPDRLKEEKRRGITIELGFAFLDLPSSSRIGIVDVPGHERFVRTMVAGAAGMDMVVLVIAADEGVMPQTREHLDVCEVLGVKTGIVVLSKVDMVEDEWLEMVREDVRSALTGTFLEEAQMYPFSAVTGQGREEIIRAIDEMASNLEERYAGGAFRLHVDRVFTMKGFGTVITGTAVEGSVSVGEEVEILPRETRAKIRGIQVHGRAVESAKAGTRTAINLQGISTDQISRGEVIATLGAIASTTVLDAHLRFLSSSPRPLKERTRVRLHTGTSEILGRVIPLEGPEIKPGESTYVQIRLEKPAVCMAGDRYVLRSYSPVVTIGGGLVLNPHPARHKRPFASAVELLRILHTGDEKDRALSLYKAAGTTGLALSELASFLRLPAKKVDELYKGLLSKKEIVQFDKDALRALSFEALASVKERILEELRTYHRKFPKKEGMPKVELEGKAGKRLSHPRILAAALGGLIGEGEIVQEGDAVRTPDHRVVFQEKEQKAIGDILDEFKRSGLTPPTEKEIRDKYEGGGVNARDLLSRLASEGNLIRVAEFLYFDADAISNLRDELVRYLEENERISTPTFKEITGLSRKYCIPLLEYFDKQKLTLRVGDDRVLRGRGQ